VDTAANGLWKLKVKGKIIFFVIFAVDSRFSLIFRGFLVSIHNSSNRIHA